MKNIRVTGNPYFLFLPFLIIYVVFILITQSNNFFGDELRHLNQAKNLLNGFYSPPAPNVELRNGPGYPLLIVPFLTLHIPLIWLKILNGLFLYLSIVFLFKVLIRLVSYKITLVICLFWACYYNSFDFIAYMYAETFSVFLISFIILLVIKAFSQDELKNTNKYIYLAGFFFGYLALTKVIFGYVIFLMLIAIGILWLFNRKVDSYKRSLILLLVSLITVAPYLFYTYQLTGRLFYWGTSGGDNLYWMSSPHEREYGNWFSGTMFGSDSVVSNVNGDRQVKLKEKVILSDGGVDSIKLYHQKDYDEVYKYSGVERDDAFKKIVFKNIRSHPIKYALNCFSNIGRILFNYPYSYSPQKPATLARIPLNGTIVLFALFCLIPTFLNWRKIIYPVRFLLFISLLYLGGSVFGSAEIRMFTIIVPILLVWIAYIINRTIKINLKFIKNN